EHGAALAAAVTEEGFVPGIDGTWGERVPFDGRAATEMYRSMAERDGVSLMHALLHYVADRREHAERWATAIDDTAVPLAFVWGDLDPVSGAHMIERVEQRRPDARIVRLADAAHWPPLEAPEAVAAELLRLPDPARGRPAGWGGRLAVATGPRREPRRALERLARGDGGEAAARLVRHGLAMVERPRVECRATVAAQAV